MKDDFKEFLKQIERDPETWEECNKINLPMVIVTLAIVGIMTVLMLSISGII